MLKNDKVIRALSTIMGIKTNLPDHYVIEEHWAKEYDSAIQKIEMSLDINLEELADGLIIRDSKIRPAELDGRSDHRIVMALSIAAMSTQGQSSIDTAEAMNVTFPDFVKLMNSIGVKMKIE